MLLVKKKTWFLWTAASKQQMTQVNTKLIYFSYNRGQNLLRQIAKMPIFSCHPGKNWNRRQMNARFPPSPYPKLFRIAWQLYTLVFRPRQLWIGGGEGVYFLSLGETGGGHKSLIENRWNCLNSFVRGCRYCSCNLNLIQVHSNQYHKFNGSWTVWAACDLRCMKA